MFYVGQTYDLKRRFSDHNTGKSIFTKKYIPWKLVYYESYLDRSLAIDREKQLKRKAKAWQELCKRLKLKR